jgi:hypothetical protein
MRPILGDGGRAPFILQLPQNGADYTVIIRRVTVSTTPFSSGMVHPEK